METAKELTEKINWALEQGLFPNAHDVLLLRVQVGILAQLELLNKQNLEAALKKGA